MALMKKKSIKQNYLYNLIYQVFALITPMLTAPYISRALGSEGVGQYSFAASIVSYFILLGNLGFTYHALRELAALQGDRKAQSKAFWEIFFARLICVVCVFFVYSITLKLHIYGRFNFLMTIMGMQVLAIALDISFLFQANDIFDIIAIRNIIIKCLAICLIFVFVKDENDLWIYVLCQCLISIISNLTLWTKLPKVIDKVKIRDLNILKHFKPSITLFIPQIAISVYNILDRTLIGLLVKGEQIIGYDDGHAIVKMVADIENGCYEQSQKIVTMAMTVFTALSTVLVSRNSNEIAAGNIIQLKKNIYGAIDYLFFIGAPISFGIAAIAPVFSPWFFGEGYDKTPLLIVIFAPIILIVGVSNILGRQYMNPAKRDKEFTKAIFIGAGTNLLLNLILIPSLKSYGAAIASVIAEASVTIVMVVMVRKELDIVSRVKRAWKVWISSMAMFAIVSMAERVLKTPSLINTCLLVLIGIVIYFLMLALLREAYLKMVIILLKSKLVHKG